MTRLEKSMGPTPGVETPDVSDKPDMLYGGDVVATGWGRWVGVGLSGLR